jgi:flagellar hook-associated protein 2
MTTTGVDGLISGLDTTSLINAIIAADALPQTLLKTQQQTTTTFVTALQGLNSQIASLATLATSTAAAGALDLYTASSSSTALTATASSGASAGSVDLVVDQLAQTQVGVTAAMSGWPTTPAALTIVSSTGVSTDITPASSSLDDIVKAVNAAGTGVTAMKVASGSVSGVPQYRLQFSSSATGAAAAFTVYQGTSADVTAGTATDLLAQPGAAVIHSAQDAQITLWSGTAAAQSISSSSNQFTDLLPGVTVNVTAASAAPITLTVDHDVTKTSATASALVSALTGVFATISTQSAVVQSTASDGTPTVSGGVFTADGTVRSIKEALLSAASDPINGHSPSEIGVSITQDGTLEFDQDKFAAAYAADPTNVQSMMATIATRVAAAGTAASDQYDGSLTTKITGQQSVITSLGTQISDWDTRLATRRAALEQTYSNMEVQLSNLQSQSSWLTSQLASLPTTSASSSSSSSSSSS